MPALCAISSIERKVGSGTYVRKARKPAESWRFGLLIPGLGSSELFEPICGQLARLAQRQHHTLLWGDFGDKHGDADPALIAQVCSSYIRQKAYRRNKCLFSNLCRQ